MHKPSILDQNHCCATQKRPTGSLSVMMTNRDECQWVLLCQDVEFVDHQEFVQNVVTH